MTMMMWRRLGRYQRALVSGSIDDSREGIERFLRRNPNTSVVAEMDGALLVPFSGNMVAARAVCIMSAWMLHTDSTALAASFVAKAIEALKAEQINKVYLIAFTRNEGGNAF